MRIIGSPFKTEIGYLNKWVPIAVMIGIVAGIGAVALAYLIDQFTTLFMVSWAGYIQPSPLGEGSTTFGFSSMPYLLPIITTLGGLISGIIVFKLAPEAEGHGTDAAIAAFHNKKGDIRVRVPFVKLLASAITIGSGGSGGREGPTALIGAGFGSFLGKIMHLQSHERSMVVAIGIGAGIGAIFKTPFGGAVLAAEILYLGDFEASLLPPALISSTISYSIYASIFGWTPIFGNGNQYFYHDPTYLPLYAILGTLCGVMAIVYVKSFYGIRDIFQRWKIPNYLKPAIGGLMVGLIGMAMPEVLGMGYGWLQIAINGDFATLSFIVIVALILAKIIATSLTIGSGGSGGVFAPALFIGGMIGAGLWMVCGAVIPNFTLASAPFVIVGMMAFFGAAGKAPIAVILMVAEMTASYALLVPAMTATAIAYIISGKNTIYRSQLASKTDSPAHKGEYSIEVLRGIKVQTVMTKNVKTVPADITVQDAWQKMQENKFKGLPVVDGSKAVVGMITLEDVLLVPEGKRASTKVDRVMSRSVIFAYQDENLGFALEKMFAHKIGRLPVLQSETQRTMVGIISRDDIGRAYHTSIQEISEELR